VRPRGLLTTRAARWAITQIRSEHASVQGVARQLGVRWRTVWSAIKPILTTAAEDETRFAGVSTLGVDEHVWHHVSTKAPEDGGRGPKELTGMVDLTVDEDGQVRARLLDLVPGRTRAAYADWLQARGEEFTAGVDVATLDPFQGYKSAIDDELADATAVLDAFHVVALGTRCVDEVRRRVQQDTTGHRGRKGDPLYGIQTILRAGEENLTDKQRARIERAFAAHAEHDVVDLTWQCAQQLRSAYKQTDKTAGREIAERIVTSFPTCPIPEVARLGRTLRKWKEAFLAYFDTGATNGGTEAINGLIELHRRISVNRPSGRDSPSTSGCTVAEVEGSKLELAARVVEEESWIFGFRPPRRGTASWARARTRTRSTLSWTTWQSGTSPWRHAAPTPTTC
jgi:transposase